jgi:hypothetical protein
MLITAMVTKWNGVFGTRPGKFRDRPDWRERGCHSTISGNRTSPWRTNKTSVNAAVAAGGLLFQKLGALDSDLTTGQENNNEKR